MRAFIAANILIAAKLATGAATLFPDMLYSTLGAQYSMTAYAAASSPRNLIIASIWWPIAFVLAASYFIFISIRYRGKVSVRRDTQGYY